MRMLSKLGLVIITVLFLASCGSTGNQAASSAEQERLQALEQQRALAEERQRQAEARQLEEAREAERQAQMAELAEQRRMEEEREAQEAARREADRQRQIAARRAAEQARIVAAQQARIEQLRAQIAANAAATGNLEAANAVLRQAVTAAEQLTDALATEEEKYNNTDPATGEPLEELEASRLQALAQEVESLSNQAEALMAQP